jgi:dihydrofolate reductase
MQGQAATPVGGPGPGHVPRLVLLAAVASNGVIGRDGALPWHLPDDLRRFKGLTLGKPVLMGRRTAESIGRPLPGRRNLVLTSRPDPPVAGMESVASLGEALARCAQAPELCVIGGAGLYRLALPLADALELTLVHADIPGDVCFPEIDPMAWRVAVRSEHPTDERHAWPLSFVRYERATA